MRHSTRFLAYVRSSTLCYLLLLPLVLLIGCTPRTYSINTPDKKVTLVQLEQEEATTRADLELRAASLNAEITAFKTKSAAARIDLSAQVARNTAALEAIGGVLNVIDGQPWTLATIFGALTQGLAAFLTGKAVSNTLKKRSAKNRGQTPPSGPAPVPLHIDGKGGTPP